MAVRFLSCVFFITTSLSVYGQDIKYSFLGLKTVTLENANAVVRDYQTEATIISKEEAKVKVKKIVTILNENGKGHATFAVRYDKLIKIDHIKANVYDASGKVVKKLKKSDIQDISAISDFSIFEDSRAKVADLSHTSYPYTVEYEYEKSVKNILFLPDWYPQDASLTSIESASFKVITPQDYKLRYKEINLTNPAAVKTTDQGKQYTWKVTDLPGIKREPQSVAFQELVPIVLVGPAAFIIQGYPGDMSTWESFGAWNYELNKGRDQLSSETVETVKQLVSGVPDKRAKIKAIYEYLQSKTRYVSIQLGIGGWQTFEASFVDEKSYGDCKALSNYTQAMLKSVGIDSYYTLIYADRYRPDIVTDFPSNQFNHVILSVPMEDDTVWLECTSQLAPFGFLGTSTSDRHALMVTENGGKLVKTSNYSHHDSRQVRTSEVQIDKEGHGIAQIDTDYSGLEYETVYSVLNASNEDQKKWLYQNLDIPSFEIMDYTYSQEKKALPIAREELKLHLRKYASNSGKRMFLTPNLANRRTYVPPKTEERKTDVVTKYAYTHQDTVKYLLPEGYHIEFLPESESFKTSFGSYTCTFESTSGQLIYTRQLEMYKGRFPAETYSDYRDFLQKVVKADKIKVVLKGTT